MSSRDSSERATLSARLRLRSDADFRRVLQRGARVADERVALRVMRSGLDHVRWGLRVGRALGGAVERNRIKRRWREAFRLARSRLPTGVDIVCLPRAAQVSALPDAVESLLVLVERALLRLPSS